MVSTAPDGGPARAGAACDAPGRAEKLPVFVLTGPTGAGKSGWAERLAEAAPVEIVSVDSALVYRGMDIGSAKPDRALRRRLPHHLIDICEPTDNYSAGRFVADATAAIEAIHARGKVPLLVGGTMLYLRALLHGLAQLPEASPEVRRQIDERAAREGWSSLHAELARLDPLAAERISCADPQRIQRALEVCYMTGQPISELQRDTVSPLKGYPVRAWALAPANGGLAIPNVPNATTLCGAGAIRPTPLTTACTKQVDGAGLQAAVDAAKPGDRICATGTSPQRLKVTRSGTAAAPILVLGDGRITVKGLSIDANNVTVGGLNLTGAAAPGVEMTGNGITLVNNTIASPRGGDGDGIRFFGSNLRILHNTVSDVRNLHGAHADCMQTFSSDTPPSQHVLIDSNRCDKIDNQCLIAEGPNSSAGDGSGKGNSSDITFTRNYCDSNASQAVMIDDVQNVSVTHNQITGGNEKAFAFDNKSTGAKVLGNILGLHIGFEVGMDGSSKHGYLGPLIGGLP